MPSPLAAKRSTPCKPRAAAPVFKHAPPVQPLVYTLDEAGVVLNVSYSTLKRMLAAGKLRAIHLSARAVRISAAEVHALVQQAA